METKLELFNKGVLIPFFKGLLKDSERIEYVKHNKSLIKAIHDKLLILDSESNKEKDLI